MPRTVVIALADGVTDSCSSITLDILRTANQLAAAERAGRWSTPPFRIRTASLRGRPVRAASGTRMSVDGPLAAEAASAAVLVLPGYEWGTLAQLSAGLLRRDLRALGAAAREASARGTLIAAGCSATFIVAAAGLLDDQVATTTWWFAQEFRRRFPAVRLAEDKVVTAAPGILCAGTALAQTDLALLLVQRFAGAKIARLCARYLLVDERLSQSPYMMLRRMAGADPLVEKVEAWVRRHVEEEFDLARLSRGVGTSSRTLARRLQSAGAVSPGRLVRRLRVEAAAHLLESTDAAFEEISARVGYQDPAALRRALVRETGRGPREIRRQRSSLQSLLSADRADRSLRRGKGASSQVGPVPTAR